MALPSSGVCFRASDRGDSCYDARMKPFDDLSALGLPFIIRSPDSTRHEQPSWWTGKLTGKWVVEAYDHAKREMYLGSGETFEAALTDLHDGIRKESEPRFWDLEKR